MNYDPHEPSYTIKDASKIVFRKPAEIYSAIVRGELNASQIPDGSGRHGWKYMITESDLRKWINGDEKEEPIHINASFTPISQIFKEGESMTGTEVQKKLDNAVVDEHILLTVEEAAEYIGWSTWKVRTLIKEGVLLFEKEPRKNGGHPSFTYAILKDSCDAYIAEHGKGTGITYKPRKKNMEDIAEPQDTVATVEIQEEPKEIVTPIEVAAGVASSKFEDLIASLRISYNCAYKAGYEDGYDQARKEFEAKLKEVFKV